MNVKRWEVSMNAQNNKQTEPEVKEAHHESRGSALEEKRANTWAMSAHLSAFIGFIGIPFANIFGPLVIWLLKKDELEIVNRHGIESLNFQISMTIYFLISILLCFVIIGFLLIALIVVANIILVIQAAVEASKGKMYHYPATIRFIRI
jgi:hypothetical protein